MISRGLAVCAALLLWSAAEQASAQFWGGYANWTSNYVFTDRQIPYFAQHPPVYYSGITPRTYGQSPYAYPPYSFGWGCGGCGGFPQGFGYAGAPRFFTAPPAAKAEPKPTVALNPYVKEPVAEAQPAAQPGERPAPLVIYNPFVTDKNRVANAGG